jgi:hypothetical protein
VQALVAAYLLKKTRHVAEGIILPSFELSIIAPLLAQIEHGQLRSPLLKSIQERLISDSTGASKQREDLAVLGADANAGVHPEALLRWAEAPNRMKPEWAQWLSLILCIFAIAGAVVWGAWSIATPLI